MACFVLEQLLMLVGPKLSHDARRTIYPELLKRLDDSSNQVRVFVMCVLVCIATHACSCFCLCICAHLHISIRILRGFHVIFLVEYAASW
jgi:hypothetical protein